MPNRDTARFYIENQDFFTIEQAKKMSAAMMFAIVNTLEEDPYSGYPLNPAMKLLLTRAYAIRWNSEKSHQRRINAKRAK